MKIEFVEMDRATKIGYIIAITCLIIFVVVALTEKGGI